MLRKATVSVSVSLKSCTLSRNRKRHHLSDSSQILSLSPTAHVLHRVPGAVVLLLLVRAFCRSSSDQGSTKTSADDIVRRCRKRTLAAGAGFQGHTRRREGREREKHRPKQVGKRHRHRLVRNRAAPLRLLLRVLSPSGHPAHPPLVNQGRPSSGGNLNPSLVLNLTPVN
jgi:hypothetical protein